MDSCRVTFAGWNRFSDTGEPYRQWTFNEATTVEFADGNDLHIPKRARFSDCGPQVNGDRFRLWIPTDSDWETLWSGCDEALAATILDFVEVPRWTNDAWAAVGAAELRDVLKELFRRQDEADRARAQLAQRFLNPPRVAAPPEIPRPVEPVENDWLRLHKRGGYASGDEYIIWEFKRDYAPIRARKGDRLWDEADDDLTPFRLKRNGKEIGCPEWWQLEALFRGLGRSGSKLEERISSVEATYQTAIPGGVWKANRATDEPDTRSAPVGNVFVATHAIERAGVQSGDLILYVATGDFKNRHAAGIKAPWHRLRRSHFGALRENLGSLEIIDSSWSFGRTPASSECRERLGRYLERSRPQHGDKSSCVVVIRISNREPSSSPITCNSDDAAIFELIHECGGTLRNAGAE